MNRRKFKLPSEADLRGHMRFAASKNIWVGIDFDGSGPAMRHALTLAAAVDIYAWHPNNVLDRHAIARLIVVEWAQTCTRIEERIAFLARHASGVCPV